MHIHYPTVDDIAVEQLEVAMSLCASFLSLKYHWQLLFEIPKDKIVF